MRRYPRYQLLFNNHRTTAGFVAHQLSAQWDGIEGLVARRLSVSVATRTTSLRLTTTKTMGRHRLGIKFRGIDTDHVYRVSARLSAASPINVDLELRDDAETHHGTASFKLHEDAAYGSDPDVIAFGLGAKTNGWTYVWAEMRFTGDLAVVYLWLANPLGKTEFLGDGRTSIIFWGIDIVRRD